MTAAGSTRELTVFRSTFFFQLLLGIASALFGITMTVLFEVSRRNDFFLGLTSVGLVWLGSGSLGLIASHVIQRGCFIIFMRVCGIVMVALSVIWIAYFWLDAEYGSYRWDLLLSSLTICSITATMVVIVAYILSIETESQEIQIGKRMVACSWLICTVASFIIIWFETLSQIEFLVIGVAIGWGATILGHVGLGIAVRRENKPRGRLVRTISPRVNMKMTCPQCQQWLEVASGPARCDECDLRIIVEIKEPRCVCGYLLYELKGSVCPECGREIERHTSMKTPQSSLA